MILILPVSKQLPLRTTLMDAIIKTGKTLVLIRDLHNRKAFSFIKDRRKVIMQVFRTIGLLWRDLTSCC